MAAIILSIVDLAISNSEVIYDWVIIVFSFIFIITLLCNFLTLMYFISFYFMALIVMSSIMISLRKIYSNDTIIKQSRDYVNISFSILFILYMAYYSYYK